VDKITEIPSNYDKKALLVIDQEVPMAEKFYGIQQEFDALYTVVENIVRRKIVSKLILRSHPGNRNLERWSILAKDFSEIVDISSSANDLDFDFSRSSISLGLFSGAQIASLANGIPSFFLWESGWYYTPDLAPFYNDFFISPESIIDIIAKLLNNSCLYERMRGEALDVARIYYQDRQQCNFDDEFMDRLLE